MKTGTRCQHLWDAARAGLRKKIVVISAYSKKGERFQIGNLTIHLEELD